MFWGVLGEEPIGSVFSKQDPQPALKQFYDLRVFLVGYPYAYRLECLVVHCDRLKKERLVSVGRKPQARDRNLGRNPRARKLAQYDGGKTSGSYRECSKLNRLRRSPSQLSSAIRREDWLLACSRKTHPASCPRLHRQRLHRRTSRKA